MWRSFLRTLLLSALLMSCGFSCAALAQGIVFQYVPEGYQTQAAGYWASEDTGRLILRTIRTYRRERDEWKSAYEAEKQAAVDFASGITVRIDELNATLNDERSAWAARVAALERQARRRWAVGVFGGWDAVRGEAVIGAGLVFSIVRF